MIEEEISNRSNLLKSDVKFDLHFFSDFCWTAKIYKSKYR